MPEMLPFCDRRFRIARIANKTCVNAETVFIGALEECVVLQMQQRCDGSGHGDCQMGCNFFWKAQWLNIVDGPGETAVETETTGQTLVQLTSLAAIGENRYRCQATQLEKIATPVSVGQLGQYVHDYRSGVPASSIAKFFTGLATRKLLGISDSIQGSCNVRTPASDLQLAVGDSVKVKSMQEIQETLDKNGCNRGLWFDPAEMKPFCGKTMVVSRIVKRLINEQSGDLRHMRVPAVVLSETECSGVFRRFCSRGMLHFWREIWLEKA